MPEVAANEAAEAPHSAHLPQITSQTITSEQTEKLSQLIELIPEILQKTDNPVYDEIYGYRINVASKEHVSVPERDEILLKFLIANDYNVATTKEKLIGTLNWRNKFRPLSAAFEEDFAEDLESLGVMTVFKGQKKPNLKVASWSLYGNMNPKKLFEIHGETNSKLPGTAFLRWRIGTMERSLTAVDFTSADNHKVAQIHDHNGFSMFKMDASLKAVTKEIVLIFEANYPELLSVKFFINVPAFMSWVFYFFKKVGIVSEATMKKFEVLNGGDLSEWFGKENLPREYNGGADSKYKDLKAVSCEIKAVERAYAKILAGVLRAQDAEKAKTEVAEAKVEGKGEKEKDVTEAEDKKNIADTTVGSTSGATETSKKEEVSKKEAVVDNTGPEELEAAIPNEKFSV